MDLRRECVALLLLYHTGAALEIIVPPTYRLRVGSSALIPCNYTVGRHLVDPTYFAAFWYFQGKQILSYDDQVRTIDPRYSITTEKVLNGIVDLSISKIRISDAGVYTCSVLYSPIQKKEDITVEVEASPQLVITNNVVGMNEESVLNCSITGFYPEDITITWLRGTETLGPVTMDGPRSNPDGTFRVDSSVTITPTEEDRERDFSCRVQHHKSLQEPVQIDFKLIYRETKSDNNQTNYILFIIPIVVILAVVILAVVIYKRQKIEKTEMPLTSGTQPGTGQKKETQMPLTIAKNNNPAEPMKTRRGTQPKTDNLRMEDIEVPDLIINQIAILTCTLYNYINGEYTVKWLEEKEGNEPIAVIDSRGTITIDRGDQNTCKSSLTIRRVTKEYDGIKFICRVEGPNSEWTEEKCTVYLHVTGRENSQKSPERNPDEPRSENRTEKAPVQSHEPPAEQEGDLQEEYYNHENPKEKKLSNSKGEANKVSGEEGTEEHSLFTKLLDEKEINTSGERSTMEDEEEVTQEKEGNEKPSEPINTSSPEEEIELEEDDHDNEETSLMSKNLEN